MPCGPSCAGVLLELNWPLPLLPAFPIPQPSVLPLLPPCPPPTHQPTNQPPNPPTPTHPNPQVYLRITLSKGRAELLQLETLVSEVGWRRGSCALPRLVVHSVRPPHRRSLAVVSARVLAPCLACYTLQPGAHPP